MSENQLELSIQDQKEKILRDNGLSLFVRLNASRFEWLPKNNDANVVSPRFTSREQATDYAIYKLKKQKKADEAIEYMINFDNNIPERAKG